MPNDRNARDPYEGLPPCHDGGEHAFIEIGHGMAQGRFSNGNEYVEERCTLCGAVFNAYWTGGVL